MRMSLKDWLTSDVEGLSAKENFLLHQKRGRLLFTLGISFIIAGAALVVVSNVLFFAVLLPLGGVLVYLSQKYDRKLFLDYKKLYLDPLLKEVFKGQAEIIDRELPADTTVSSGLLLTDVAMECMGLISARYKEIEALLALQTNYQTVIGAEGEISYRYSFNGLLIRLITIEPSPCHVRLLSRKYPFKKLFDKPLRSLELTTHLGKRFEFYADKTGCTGLCVMLGEALEQIAVHFKNRALALDWNGNNLFIAIEDSNGLNPIAVPQRGGDKKYTESARQAVSMLTVPIDCLYGIITSIE